MRRVLALTLALACGPAAAQDAATLADLRQELAVLYVELQRLQRELSTTGAPGTQIAGATTLERVDAIEAALSEQIRRVEALEGRIARVVADGTNRIGDLEFRICELEPGCEIGELGATLPLGGEAAAPTPAAPVAPAGEGPELAVGEQADFDSARAAYDAGEWAEAAELLRRFNDTYPGGPLSDQALFLRGEALERQGQDADAARAYLDSFSGDPSGPLAPQALLQLGLALQRLGQMREACATLAEVSQRFPQDPAASEAQAALSGLDCS